MCKWLVHGACPFLSYCLCVCVTLWLIRFRKKKCTRRAFTLLFPRLLDFQPLPPGPPVFHFSFCIFWRNSLKTHIHITRSHHIYTAHPFICLTCKGNRIPTASLSCLFLCLCLQVVVFRKSFKFFVIPPPPPEFVRQITLVYIYTFFLLVAQNKIHKRVELVDKFSSRENAHKPPPLLVLPVPSLVV